MLHGKKATSALLHTSTASGFLILSPEVRSVISAEGAAEPVLPEEETLDTVEDRIREVVLPDRL